MKTHILAAAAAVLVVGQVAPAFAQLTAGEQRDRSQGVNDENGVRRDTAEIRGLNAKVAAVHMRMKHDHGAALETDRKELAGLEAQEKSTRANEAGLNGANQGLQKDYHKDLSQDRPH